MYYNRDLSWLGFNKRVLLEAADESVPLFERFRFLSIFSSNLDEFFRVRYPAIAALSTLKPKIRNKVMEEVENQNLAELAQTEIRAQLELYGDILTNQLLPALDNNGFHLYYNEPLHPEHLDEVTELFLSRALAFVQPVLLKGTAKDAFMPENNKLYLIATLRLPGAEDFSHAVVSIPSENLPRFYSLSKRGDKQFIIFLDDIIRANMHCIFPGFEISGVYSFKFNRDAELHLDETYSSDMLLKIERQLKKRDFGPPSRFLFEPSMPRSLQLFLASTFEADHDEMFEGGRYHNLRDFGQLPVSGDGLEFPSIKALAASGLHHCSDIFRVIYAGDLLLHFPYDSYNPILIFFNQAAIDPDVAEIYITLYRVAADSLIANALISAARNGKKVTAFVELKARFDEANNIQWSRKMEEAGIEIVYSIQSIKVHSKTALVIRNDAKEEQHFSVISTGNFNETTARFYADHTLLTANKNVSEDLLKLFRFLKQKKKPKDGNIPEFRTLLVSQCNMVPTFDQLVCREIDKAENNQPALIRIKLNNLEEPHMIALLQQAAAKGVQVQLLIRSICCLLPTLPNMEVRRVVDRFLEHSRIILFGQQEDEMLFIGSADWMTRNLHRRIEVMVPVADAYCKQQLVAYFDLQWQNTRKVVKLLPDGTQEFLTLPSEAGLSPQEAIYQYLQHRT